MSENDYKHPLSDNEIMEKFMKILKFYNEIIKSNPLIVSDQDYLKYKKQQKKHFDELKNFDSVKEYPTVNFNAEVGEHKIDLETHDIDPTRYVLNIPEHEKTRFNVYILKKINDLENDLEEFLLKLNYFYLKYKKYYDNFSLYNIFAATSMTLIESISLMFKPQVYTGVVAIVLSTSVALSTAVLKLKNYKDRIEEIVKTTEKVYSCQAQLFTFDKRIKAQLNMSKKNDEDL